uniref:Uncharacterized protein n=1 Tax=Geospiza parvula TaxID=87175 RepID=A0A8U8BLH5_GEOPR
MRAGCLVGELLLTYSKLYLISPCKGLNLLLSAHGCTPGMAPAQSLARSWGTSVKVGEKVSLPCCHEIPSSESLRKYRVYWQKNITDVVLAYSEGNMLPQHERYQNRTEMDPRNLTLWISPVEILDNGSYQCVVQRNSVLVCSESVILFVTADFSKPNITAEVSADSCKLTEMVITCSSHGGFPKPRISGALNNMSMEWNASWVSESSFSPYNVTGKMVLNVTKDVTITCSVEYSGFATSTSLLGLPPPRAPPYQHDFAASCVTQTWYLN